MRSRLFIALALVLVAAPVARAQDPAPAPAPAPSEECTAEMTEERAVAALQQALSRPLPPRAGRVVKVRVTPCAPGRLVLRVARNSRDGVLLARGERTLRSTTTATIQLRTTKAVERYRGKKLRLDLHAVFTP
jgi:hypothetical protein